MYTGNNPTAIRSREWLVSEIFKLMDEMPYRKITVRTLCERADLSRQTFYNLFEEKDDIIRFYIRRTYHEKDNELKKMPDLTILDIAMAFSHIIENHRENYKKLVNYQLEYIIMQEFNIAIIDFAEIMAISKYKRNAQYVAAFFSGALTQILIHWISDNNPISADEVAVVVESIISGTYYLPGK